LAAAAVLLGVAGLPRVFAADAPPTAPRSDVQATDVGASNEVATPASGCPALLRHEFTPIRGGAAESLCRYQGSVLLVVNTASQCGYTPQYESLETLYRKYRSRGLVVIGFPSNDFAGQEPGTNTEIAEFCRTVYGVQFPMYEKASVSGLKANAFYAELAATTRASPRWNFHKYVVDRSGRQVTSFASDVRPDDRELVKLIERLLAEPAPRPAT
jgi:glutathione peroxidase